MELIGGRRTEDFSADDLYFRVSRFRRRMIDLGTGDGRFVISTAVSTPDVFVVGVDACRENLRQSARKAPDNALFVAANALSLPDELIGFADHLTINFPWGSLLEGLVAGDMGVLVDILKTCAPGARVDVRLNESALAEVGLRLQAGSEKICANMARAGISGAAAKEIDREQLRSFPSTWAHKMAFGRLPRGVHISGKILG